MPWYQSVPLIGSAAGLSMLILFRPSSEARLLGFTILIGLMMLLSLGLALKQVITAVYLASWLASG